MKYRAFIYGTNPRIEEMEHKYLLDAIKETKQILKNEVAKYKTNCSAKIMVYSEELTKWIYCIRVEEIY